MRWGLRAGTLRAPSTRLREANMARLLALAALAFCLVATGDDKNPKDAKAELEKLTGTWKGVSVVRDGNDIPKPEAESVRLVVTGEKYKLTEGGEEIEGTHKLDPTKKPKEI